MGNTGDGSLLIQLLPGQSPAAVASLVSADSASMRMTSIPGLLEVTGSSTELANLLANAAMLPSVQYAEPNHTVHLDLMPNDPSFTNGTLWGMSGTNGIHAPAAWDRTTGSRTVTIADIDTGMDYNHPDLYQNVWINQSEIPPDRKAHLTDVDQDGSSRSGT